MTDPEPTRDAEIIVLRDNGGRFTAEGAKEIGAEGRENARIAAARRKAVEVHRVKGALLRSDLLPRKLTKKLAEGAGNRMLAQLLQGEIEPRTAKEAAEVAKIAFEIARHEPSDAKPEAETRVREELEASARLLGGKLLERAQAAADAAPQLLGGKVPDDEDIDDVDLTEYDFAVDAAAAVPPAGEGERYDPEHDG